MSTHKSASLPVAAKRTSEASFALVLSIVIPLIELLLGIYIDLKGSSRYQDTEWLVSYAGGFVRRGLAGSGLILLSDWTGQPVRILFVALKIAVSVGFFACLSTVLARSAGRLGVLRTLLVLGVPAVTLYGLSIGRVDLLMVFLTLLHQQLAVRLPRKEYVLGCMALMATFGVAAGLQHEGLLFLAVPLNLVIACRKLGSSSIVYAFCLMSPVVAACMLGLRFPGTAEQAEAIRHAFSAHGLTIDPRFQASVVDYFGHQDLKSSLLQVQRSLTPLGVLLWSFPFVVSLSLVWGLLCSLELPLAARKRLFGVYVLFPVCCALPLYFVGVDWERWYCLPIVAGLLCLLLDPEVLPTGPLPALKGRIQFGVLALIGFLFFPASADSLRFDPWVCLVPHKFMLSKRFFGGTVQAPQVTQGEQRS